VRAGRIHLCFVTATMEFSSMFKSSRSHLRALTLTLVLALALIAAFATVASAYPNYAEVCSNCHIGPATAPVVTVTSGPDVDPASYTVQQQSAGWAAFDLSADSTRLAGGTGSDGTFTAPLSHYVRVCASDGASTGTFSQAWYLKPKVATGHGAISPAADQLVATGGSQVFTFTAEAGYHVSDVRIDGTSDPGAVSAGSYTYGNVQADSTIQVTFAPDIATHTITATAGPNGTISPAGATNVAQGSGQTYVITPNTGYAVDKLLVDDVAKTAALRYAFSNVTANHTIAVTFKVAAPAKSTISLSLSGLKAGAVKCRKTITAKGTLKPARATKATLTFQRKVGRKWVKATAKTATVKSNGAFSLAYKPTRKGSWRVQAAVKGTSAYGKAASPWRSFRVK
jgi:hypothetical protein